MTFITGYVCFVEFFPSLSRPPSTLLSLFYFQNALQNRRSKVCNNFILKNKVLLEYVWEKLLREREKKKANKRRTQANTFWHCGSSRWSQNCWSFRARFYHNFIFSLCDVHSLKSWRECVCVCGKLNAKNRIGTYRFLWCGVLASRLSLSLPVSLDQCILNKWNAGIWKGFPLHVLFFFLVSCFFHPRP